MRRWIARSEIRNRNEDVESENHEIYFFDQKGEVIERVDVDLNFEDTEIFRTAFAHGYQTAIKIAERLKL